MKNEQPQKDSSVIELLTGRSAECDAFEGYSHPHASRVAAIADELAKRFNLGREDRVSLRQASLAHDFGELVMARDYIKRPDKLSDDERLDLARHPVFGEQEATRFGADRAAQLLVRWHQEWWNGSGYPDALRCEQIPLAARILKIADAFASLTDARPYRKAFSLEETRKHLSDWAGLEFDPRIVTACLSIESHAAFISYAESEKVVTPEEPQVVAASKV